MKIYRDRAAAEAFKSNNPHYDPKFQSGLKRCDLHGLTVKEAIQRVKDHLQACVDIGVTETLLITGRGKGSKGGIPKIKPATVSLLESKKWSYLMHQIEVNDGSITVQFQANESFDDFLFDSFSFYQD